MRCRFRSLMMVLAFSPYLTTDCFFLAVFSAFQQLDGWCKGRFDGYVQGA